MKYTDIISTFSRLKDKIKQIEGEGRKLFLDIDGDEDTIMGLPIKKIKQYLSNYE